MVYECSLGDAEVVALLLAKNEVEVIGDVIDSLFNQGVREVIVVDGNSTDGTAEIAKFHNANVVLGKGNGKASDFRMVQERFRREYSKCDAVFTIDADGTYNPENCLKVVKPIIDNYADAVIGARKPKPGSMRKLNEFGGSLITLAARVAFRKFGLKDILSGCYGYKPEVLSKLNLSSTGFGLEVDVVNALLRGKYRVDTVTIDYYPRCGQSKLNLLTDSLKIPLEFLRVYVTNSLTNSNAKNYECVPRKI